MSQPLHWDKKKADISTGIVFGVMFFVVEIEKRLTRRFRKAA